MLLTTAVFSYNESAMCAKVDPPPVTLKSLDTWGNVFAGQKATFHFQVAPAIPAGADAVWIVSPKGKGVGLLQASFAPMRGRRVPIHETVK